LHDVECLFLAKIVGEHFYQFRALSEYSFENGISILKNRKLIHVTTLDLSIAMDRVLTIISFQGPVFRIILKNNQTPYTSYFHATFILMDLVFSDSPRGYGSYFIGKVLNCIPKYSVHKN